MKENFAPALARVLVYEGGKVDDPQDPGGRTAYGVTQHTYSAWLRTKGRPPADVWSITQPEVATIYKEEYWDRIDGDLFPSGLDFAVFDGAVNSGCGSSIMWLQGALGNVSVDGGLGTKTLAAVEGCDDEATIDAYCQRRLGSLKRLTTYKRYGTGWSARISNVKKIGDAWAEAGQGANTGPSPVIVSDLGGHKKAKMDDVKVSPFSTVQAHAATAGAATATAAAQAGQSLAPAADTFLWLKYVLGALTIIAAVAGIVVMIGKQWNDAAANGDAKAVVPPTADDGLPAVKIIDSLLPSPVAVVQASPSAAPVSVAPKA